MAKSGATSPTLKALSAAGVLAAALIGLSANVLAARFYERWDWTSQGLYTLSPATVETLHDLQEPVDVVVFLSASDPLSVSVRNMLTAYGAETRQLKTRFVDPDRNPAEFLALQQKYGIITGKTEDGRVVTDAAIVVARGDRHWYVTSDDIVSYDESDNRAKPKLEQALTEAIRNVLQKESTTICFSAGHQEISIDDGGPNGLGELRYRLEKNNYRVVTLDLGAPKPDVALDECRVVVVAGPQVEVPANVTSRLSKWFSGGGNVLVLANPILDEDNRIRPTGLEPLTRTAGIELNADFVVEQDDKLRLPTGLGESFFATPKEHAITAGLFRAGEPRFRVLVSAAQSLRASGKQPVSLLVTSAEAVAVKDIRPFVEQGKAIEKGADGLIAVAAGAGGHAGAQSPLALISEIRAWFDGPLALSGAIANGRSILAARAMGADFAYIGSPFIATDEANAQSEYKEMIVASGAEDIVYSNLFTGVHGNYLKPSIARAGMDPDNLEQSDPTKMNFGENREKPKSWKEIWGSGQGIGAIKEIQPAAKLIDRLAAEYQAAREALCG